MEVQKECKLPVSSLLQKSVDAGFARVVNRYQSAWSNSTTAVKPPLAPADAFFVPSDPSDSTKCPLCTETFSTNERLRSHISESHPNAYGPTEILTADQLKFPNPLTALHKPSSMPTAPFTGSRTAFPADAWLPMSPEALRDSSSPLATLSPNLLGDGKVGVANPSLFCSLCLVQCDTAPQLEKHWNGQKHLRKVDIHLAFTEASKTFEAEGIKQLAPTSWTCAYCKTEVTGKTPILQHLDAVKHKKNRIAAAAKTPRGKKRTRPLTPAGSSSRSPSDSADAGAARNKTMDDEVTISTSRFVERDHELPPVPVPPANADPNPHKDPPNELLSILQAAEATPSASNSVSPSVCISPPFPSRGDAIGEKSTTTEDPLCSPASNMNAATPEQQISRSESVLSTNSDATSTPNPTLKIPSPKNGKRNQSSPRNHRSPRNRRNQRKSPASKLKTLVSCVLCNVRCNSMESLTDHLASTKHKQKQRLQEQAGSVNGSAGSNAQSVPVKKLHCEVCNISCCGPDNYNSHMQGKPHAKRLRASQENNDQ